MLWSQQTRLQGSQLQGSSTVTTIPQTSHFICVPLFTFELLFLTFVFVFFAIINLLFGLRSFLNRYGCYRAVLGSLPAVVLKISGNNSYIGDRFVIVHFENFRADLDA
jgi:hypothetical protein